MWFCSLHQEVCFCRKKTHSCSQPQSSYWNSKQHFWLLHFILLNYKCCLHLTRTGCQVPTDTLDPQSSIFLPLPHKGRIILWWDIVHPPSCFTWRLPDSLLTLWNSRCKVGGITQKGMRPITVQLSSQCQITATALWQIHDTALKSPHEKFVQFLGYCFVW